MIEDAKERLEHALRADVLQGVARRAPVIAGLNQLACAVLPAGAAGLELAQACQHSLVVPVVDDRRVDA